MIKIHGLSGELETIKYIGNLGALIDQYNPQWREKEEWEGELYVNGNLVLPDDFDSVVVSELCTVDIYMRPHGGVFKAVGKLLGGVINLAFGFLMPRSRSSNHNRVNTPQGERLEASEIKANQARLGSVVPEAFGKYRVYMDYLSEPRRYFKDRRQQEIEALLCVGVGDYVTEQVKIGDTDIGDMENSEYAFYPPNIDVGRYAELWHTVDEVGATSSGTAGLELSIEAIESTGNEDIKPVGGYIFNGDTITRADGSSFSADLSAGDFLYITLPLEYENRTVGGIQNMTYTIVKGYLDHCKPVNDLFGNRSSITDLGGGNYEVFWYTQRYIPHPWGDDYPGRTTYTGILLDPRNGLYRHAFGVDKRWEITEISGDTIKIKDGFDGSFPLNITSVDASLRFEIDPNFTRSELTNIFTSTPLGVKTSLVELDFFFPQGLCYITDDGGLSFENCSVEVLIKDTDNQSFSLNKTFNYREATNDQIGFSEQITLPYPMRPRIQMRRIGSINNSVQSHSQVTWYGLKSRLPSRNKYPSWTTMGVRIQSGGKLSAQSENTINAVVTRKLPVLQENGEWSTPQPTRDIASAIKYITDRIGYTDQEIDMHELLHLHNTKWKPRNETFDYVFDEVTVKQAIDNVLNAGMSDMTIANGKIKPVRDDVRTAIEQSYSAQNTISQISKTFRARKINDFDGVEVEYIDAEQGYEKKVIVCKLPQSNGFKLRKVSIKGVTDRKRAWQIGMRLASEDRYVNKDYSIKTEMDALNSEYGSFIGIIEEIPELSQSCLILQVNDDHVVVSEPPLQDATIFSWRDEYGKLQGPFNIDRVEDNRIYVQLNKKPVINLNQELPHAYIGTSQKMTRTALVDDISPNGTNNATIRASNYDERVYAYDNSEIIE